MDPASELSASVAFGRFRVLPHRRELLAEGHAENEVPRGYNRGTRRGLVLLKQQTGSGADQSLNKGLPRGKA